MPCGLRQGEIRDRGLRPWRFDQFAGLGKKFRRQPGEWIAAAAEEPTQHNRFLRCNAHPLAPDRVEADMPLTSRSAPLPSGSALPVTRMAVPDWPPHRQEFTEGSRAGHCWHARPGEDQEFAAPQSRALGALCGPRPGYRGLYQAQGRARAEIEAREMLTTEDAYRRTCSRSQVTKRMRSSRRADVRLDRGPSRH